MAKSKYYAVRQGARSGIYKTWSECRQHVLGVSGAVCRAFNDFGKAFDWVTNAVQVTYFEIRSENAVHLEQDFSDGFAVAFTDGAYKCGEPAFGYGAVVLKNTQEPHELSGICREEEYLSSGNTAGEIYAVLAVLNWAVIHKIPRLKIYHDFIGISKLVDGSVKARSPLTQMYVEQYEKYYRDRIRIVFQKVRSHRGILYNERADNLAKSALRNYLSAIYPPVMTPVMAETEPQEFQDSTALMQTSALLPLAG